MAKYQDKTVIVTGAGSGIGFALCQAFAGTGAKVALNDIDAALAEQAAGVINSAIGAERVYPCALDVADVHRVREMVDDVAERTGRLDIVIANAGITNYGLFLEYSVEALDRLTGVNIRGTFFTAQAAARQMISRGTKDGRILLMSSITGDRAFLGLGPYGVTKASIYQMARIIAIEIGKHGITVNAISPGATLTERTLIDDPEYEANWASVSPNERPGYVEDITATCLFLASPEAGHITGQTIVIDGGWSLQSLTPQGHPDQPQESSKLK